LIVRNEKDKGGRSLVTNRNPPSSTGDPSQMIKSFTKFRNKVGRLEKKKVSGAT